MANKWLSGMPKFCDLCNKKLTKYFIDGATHKGYWAIMCSPCHKEHGTGFGIGFGQRYRVSDGKRVRLKGDKANADVNEILKKLSRY